MRKLYRYLKAHPLLFLYAGLLLALPAYLINLGLMPFIEDESIRGLVALEMLFSGDYLTPTLGGELYFKKPPLYNWIIALFFASTDTYTEFVMRMPMVISLLGFGLTIFYFVKKEMGTRQGVINALLFLTCGRIIIYESMYGLIDITFSWVIYLFFMVLYFQYKKGHIKALFALSYLLISAAYLLKGLPALVFLGISFLTFFTYKRQFRLLFSWKQFISLPILIGIIGGYYWLYGLQNDVDLLGVFETLWTESTRRTPAATGMLATVIHLFTFPFEFLFHFMPLTLLVVVLFRKATRKRIAHHQFLKFNTLIFLFNIIIYWASPDIYPRYLLMFVPLFFTVVVYFYEKLRPWRTWHIRLSEWTLFVVGLAITLAFLTTPFFGLEDLIEYMWLKTASIVVTLAALMYAFYKQRSLRILWFALFIFVFRIGFNWFIIPHRYAESKDVPCKEASIELARKTQGEKLVTYWDPAKDHTQRYYGKRIINYMNMYYITAEQREILETWSHLEPGVVYLMPKRDLQKADYVHVMDVPAADESYYVPAVRIIEETKQKK
ncbi:MAG: ArnT family glycosyltransferase [Bacteroidota bacterium]